MWQPQMTPLRGAQTPPQARGATPRFVKNPLVHAFGASWPPIHVARGVSVGNGPQFMPRVLPPPMLFHTGPGQQAGVLHPSHLGVMWSYGRRPPPTWPATTTPAFAVAPGLATLTAQPVHPGSVARSRGPIGHARPPVSRFGYAPQGTTPAPCVPLAAPSAEAPTPPPPHATTTTTPPPPPPPPQPRGSRGGAAAAATPGAAAQWWTTPQRWGARHGIALLAQAGGAVPKAAAGQATASPHAASGSGPAAKNPLRGAGGTSADVDDAWASPPSTLMQALQAQAAAAPPPQSVGGGRRRRFRGVTLCKSQRWRCKIYCDKRTLNIGRFDKAIQAALAYDVAACFTRGTTMNFSIAEVRRYCREVDRDMVGRVWERLLDAGVVDNASRVDAMQRFKSLADSDDGEAGEDREDGDGPDGEHGSSDSANDASAPPGNGERAADGHGAVATAWRGERDHRQANPASRDRTRAAAAAAVGTPNVERVPSATRHRGRGVSSKRARETPRKALANADLKHTKRARRHERDGIA